MCKGAKDLCGMDLKNGNLTEDDQRTYEVAVNNSTCTCSEQAQEKKMHVYLRSEIVIVYEQ